MKTYGYANCGICGTQFLRKSGNAKYCSKKCSMKAHGETGIKLNSRPCKNCGKIIEHPSAPMQKFCDTCIKERKREQNKLQQQKYRHERGAKKIGETINCESCGKEIIRTTGIKKLCLDCVRKRDCENQKVYLKNHPDKKVEWAERGYDNYHFSGNHDVALKRDNYTCQGCGKHGSHSKLHVHHIDGKGTTIERDLRNNDIDNLITLCHSCHIKVHSRSRWHKLTLREALQTVLDENK